jgi:hypothetical protein
MSFAVDNFPSLGKLTSLAAEFDEKTPIDWHSLVSQPPQAGGSSAEKPDEPPKGSTGELWFRLSHDLRRAHPTPRPKP